MKILHLAVHLGGGVGKAHAAMAPYMPADVEQTFLLLQEPIDRRYVDEIMAAGAKVAIAGSARDVEAFAEVADVLQVEYWGHPVLEDLFRGVAPAGRENYRRLPIACWCHVSGLHSPLPAWMARCDRFVATSEITPLPLFGRVINSGFGFDWTGSTERTDGFCHVLYLGTVDFKKMHPDFFAAVDHLADLTPIGHVGVCGRASAEAMQAAAGMRRPEKVRLRGYTSSPRVVMMSGDIFFYPLRRGHYGTGENALIEAMSLGLVPVVLDNPAEASIVEDGETGIIAFSMSAAVRGVMRLINEPDLRRRLSRNAAAFARTRSPYTSAKQFADLWRSMVAKERAVA